MNKSSTSHGKKLSSLFCSIFGHHYVVSREVTDHIKEYKCIHCQKEVTTDVGGRLSSLTPQMRDINKALSEMFRKRQNRQVQRVA